MHWVTHLFLVRVRMGDSEDAWGSQWLKAGMRFFRRMSINIGDDEQERMENGSGAAGRKRRMEMRMRMDPDKNVVSMWMSMRMNGEEDMSEGRQRHDNDILNKTKDTI